LFVKESSAGARLFIWALVALALILADLRFNNLTSTRSVLGGILAPIYWVADIPAKIGNWGEENVSSRSHLIEENRRLRAEALVLKARVQKMAALSAGNTRLRALLNSTALVQDDVLVAELNGVSADPQRHHIRLNKGLDDGVFMGQPLIDAEGLMGQVVEVSGSSSRVLLITDSSHALPVQINRNGVRAIAEGTGRLDQLRLRHLAATTDVQVGDVLVTSGLGQRYPVGYPVGVVSEVNRDPGQAFARVSARPSAALNRSRHVLLVFSGEQPESASSESSDGEP
jgi:rod shape-determining protein MreC